MKNNNDQWEDLCKCGHPREEHQDIRSSEGSNWGYCCLSSCNCKKFEPQKPREDNHMCQDGSVTEPISKDIRTIKGRPDTQTPEKDFVLENEEILQILYDKGMIDFEGDEDGLTMQVPTNVVRTGKFVVDVFKEGYKRKEEDIKKALQLLQEDFERAFISKADKKIAKLNIKKRFGESLIK